MTEARTVFIDDAAKALGISRRTVYYRIREGQLHTMRVGGTQRVLQSSIDAMLARDTQNTMHGGER